MDCGDDGFWFFQHQAPQLQVDQREAYQVFRSSSSKFVRQPGAHVLNSWPTAASAICLQSVQEPSMMHKSTLS